MSGDVTMVPVDTTQTPLPYSVVAVSNDNPSAKALAAMFRHEDDRERFISGRSFTDDELRARDERIIVAMGDRYELGVGSFDQVLVMCGSCDAGGLTPSPLIIASYPVGEHGIPFRDVVDVIRRHERERH